MQIYGYNPNLYNWSASMQKGPFYTSAVFSAKLYVHKNCDLNSVPHQINLRNSRKYHIMPAQKISNTQFQFFIRQAQKQISNFKGFSFIMRQLEFFRYSILSDTKHRWQKNNLKIFLR